MPRTHAAKNVAHLQMLGCNVLLCLFAVFCSVVVMILLAMICSKKISKLRTTIVTLNAAIIYYIDPYGENNVGSPVYSIYDQKNENTHMHEANTAPKIKIPICFVVAL